MIGSLSVDFLLNIARVCWVYLAQDDSRLLKIMAHFFDTGSVPMNPNRSNTFVNHISHCASKRFHLLSEAELTQFECNGRGPPHFQNN